MNILKNILRGLDRRKAKMFSIFLVCSFLSWFVSKLSEPYESDTTFDLSYINLPDTLLASKGFENQLGAKVSANGFRFLYHNFSLKKIDLDVSKAKNLKGKFYVLKNDLKKIISPQLSNNLKLIDVAVDTLFLNVFQVKSKEVPVKPTITLTLQQNYLMEGQLVIEPSKIILKGPIEEIESITEIKTEKTEMVDLNSDFSVATNLVFPASMLNTKVSSNTARLSGKVVRFSEKVFQLPIDVLNLPVAYSIKTFPKSVSVLCKASVTDLKIIDSIDFKVVADYNDRVGDKMFLNIEIQPANAYDVRLLENQVKFILEKK